MAKRDYATDKCLHCGRLFFQNKRGTVKYCSAKCRTAAYRKRRKPYTHYPKYCEFCRKFYYPEYSPTARYCSNACRQKAYRASKRTNQ